jgi:outer membrane protein OmpA-like peptidoglycan-associated protein
LLSALLLLGMGAGVGAMVGLTLALFRPGVVDQTPLSQQVIQQSRRILSLTQPAPNIAPAVGAIPGAIATTSDRKLLITIPTDALFQANQTTLRPEARQVLEGLVNELKPYAGSTLQVGAHTTPQQNPESDRALTFNQARQVKQALAPALDSDFSWLVIGFGSTRSLGDGSGAAGRDQRIEITVTP